MSYMVSYDETCSKCGYKKAELKLSTNIDHKFISCPKCGTVDEYSTAWIIDRRYIDDTLRNNSEKQT